MALTTYWVEPDDLSAQDRTRPETFAQRDPVYEPVYLASDVDARIAELEGN
jgi:hypothetical protein